MTLFSFYSIFFRKPIRLNGCVPKFKAALQWNNAVE